MTMDEIIHNNCGLRIEDCTCEDARVVLSDKMHNYIKEAQEKFEARLRNKAPRFNLPWQFFERIAVEREISGEVAYYTASIKQTLTEARKKWLEEEIEAVKTNTPSHATREYRDTDQMRDTLISRLEAELKALK